MEEKTSHATGTAGVVAIWALVGFVVALAVGWFLFPKLLFVRQEQPIRFSHAAHVNQGLDCQECHHLGADGRFSGLPPTETCAGCHGEETGENTPAGKEIDRFVNTYVKTGKPVPWLVYQKQPDNVYFSHVAHRGFDCSQCHPDMPGRKSPPPYFENRLTGYSKDTMKMWQCERCHASMGISNACYVCHK